MTPFPPEACRVPTPIHGGIRSRPGSPSSDFRLLLSQEAQGVEPQHHLPGEGTAKGATRASLPAVPGTREPSSKAWPLGSATCRPTPFRYATRGNVPGWKSPRLAPKSGRGGKKTQQRCAESESCAGGKKVVFERTTKHGVTCVSRAAHRCHVRGGSSAHFAE